MSGNVNTSGGTKIFIGGPNSNRASVLADYQADSYVEIGEIEDGGEFGDQSDSIEFVALADGRKRKFKGPRDAGTQTIVVGDDPTDEGQAALEEAEGQNLNYNFKVELNDKLTLGGENSTHFFIGQVMSKRRNIGNASSVVKRTFAVGINSAITDTDPS
jgi:hypothetical protein